MLRLDDATSRGQPAGAGSWGPTAALMAGPADAERRIEDWVVCHLDGVDLPSGPAALATFADWHDQIADTLLESPIRRMAAAPSSSSPSRPPRPRAAPSDWPRFRVTRSRRITVIRLTDTALVRDAEIREFADDLSTLIAAGHHRIVLNFGTVERLSSQIVGAVVAAHRRCAEADGGQLRICSLQGPLAQIFEVAGVAARLAIFADERSALEAPWPEPTRPRPLPLAILSALTNRAGSDRPEEETAADPIEPGAERLDVWSDAPAPRVWLIAEGGRARGKAIAVPGPRFLIGRDPSCHLRSTSLTVSRFHAAISLREGRASLRDLGTTNGTLLNRRLLRGQEVALSDGDRLQIGPLRFRVAIGHIGNLPEAEDLIASWLLDGMGLAPEPPDAAGSAAPGEQADDGGTIEWETNGGRVLKYEVIQDVLLITPMESQLDDGTVTEALRMELHTLFEGPMPRRVVINLERVMSLSSRAVGVLLAHFLRLDRAGGALRLCQANPKILSALDGLRVPILIPLYPTVDDAVLTAWS
ncbi:MAG: FHA domain-containing protein [Isosphaeraceae bacterium]|nr:FHA domain-containing protein [Isosphaeraceae bacterium]